MSANVSKLTPKQEQAVLALLTNQGVDSAARAVGIAPMTLYRWMNEPLFDKAYRKARRDAFGQGTARLHAAASTKLRAAELVLTHGAKAIEIEDVAARVSELERAAEESKNKR